MRCTTAGQDGESWSNLGIAVSCAAASHAESTGKAIRTVLVVDDDAEVRELAAWSLRDAGHTVLEAADGAEALALFEQHPEIDLLFTDIVMPGLDGYRVAEMARERRPEIGVLYTTGFAGGTGQYANVMHGQVLRKPYHLDELVSAVARALG
jgi:CheY-like chemotaxis protein